MDKRKLMILSTTALLGLSPALAACDREDRKDIEEGVNQVEEGAEDLGNEVEKGIDQNIDTDGKDDN